MRGQGLEVDHCGHLVSLPSCALSLSPTNTGESVALLLLHLHIPDQSASIDAGKNVVTWNRF